MHSSFKTIQNICVIGAGQMGQGIAQLAAIHGYGVILVDTFADVLSQALHRIHENFQKMYKRGTLDELDVFLNIKTSLHLEDVVYTKFIIEAIPENFSLKVDLYKQIENVMGNRDYILCSNTSSLSLTNLQRELAHPARFAGFHFMNPPVLMPLVEIIPGQKTESYVLEILKNIALSLKKESIICRDTPGFILNRLLIPMINEACLMVDENIATVVDIDKTLKLGANFPMGALSLADYIGLDTVLSIQETLKHDLNPNLRVADCLHDYIAKGKLGRKTKEGFFKYD